MGMPAMERCVSLHWYCTKWPVKRTWPHDAVGNLPHTPPDTTHSHVPSAYRPEAPHSTRGAPSLIRLTQRAAPLRTSAPASPLAPIHLRPQRQQLSSGIVSRCPNSDPQLGLSKFARIAHQFAHRLQLQERLAHQIADEIQRVTGSDDVFVVGRGERSV